MTNRQQSRNFVNSGLGSNRTCRAADIPHTQNQNGLNESEALRYILESTAAKAGEPFFLKLVQCLTEALGYRDAWVTEIEDNTRLTTRAAWRQGKARDNFSYLIEGTPCEIVVRQKQMVHFAEGVAEKYPRDLPLAKNNLSSYLGLPLCDVDGTTLGHISLASDKPKSTEPLGLAVLQIFASRAEVELQHIRAIRELAESEQRANLLIESAMDGILVINENLDIRTMNSNAERLLTNNSDETCGESFADYLSNVDKKRLQKLITIEAHENYFQIPAGMTISTHKSQFVFEGTLSKFDFRGDRLYTLIFRDVDERHKAEKKIERLLEKNRYLEQSLGNLRSNELVGDSHALHQALADAKQVAGTNATVLVQGETGTGKELFARAIHNWSSRSDGPNIAVNCPALPGELIESEFFGHEKGAFTGASQKRIGRFALADGGTIFLDEIGDLPIALQAKLLRVLQEGQFEPVGSSKTQTVNVRVVAATNRDLFQAVQNGEFREDLYYRLNVFPITVPPLRDRGDDVLLLADAFLREFSVEMSRAIEPLNQMHIAVLKGYSWPGNVRELRNVIERAVIASRGGELSLEKALPEAGQNSVAFSAKAEDSINDKVLTAEEFRQFESENIRRALKQARGKVSGAEGAAAILNMKPSTLSSRIRALARAIPASTTDSLLDHQVLPGEIFPGHQRLLFKKRWFCEQQR